EYEYGVWHPIGGCGAVTRTMARICRELCVEIRLGEAVEGLLFNGRRAVGARADSGEHVADAVVVNGDFADAMTRLVPDSLRRRWTNRKIAAKRFSCSTFMMYLGIEGSYPDVAHHTIWLADNYRENLRDIEERQCPPENPSLDRKSTRLNSSHVKISYAVFCLKKKKIS